MLPKSRIIESLKFYEILKKNKKKKNKVHQVSHENMGSELTAGRTTSPEVKIQGGIFLEFALFVGLFGFYCISTFVGYLMLNPYLYNFSTIQLQLFQTI